MNCHKCDRTADFGLMAVRCVDGDLVDSIDCCRLHALELIVSGQQPFDVPAWFLEPLVEDCAAHQCECLPEQLDLCASGCGQPR